MTDISKSERVGYAIGDIKVNVGKNLAFTSAWELRELIVSGELSPVELVELFLDRIESLNPKLNAYLTVCRNEAIAAARAAEQEISRNATSGMLHGVPVSVKDLEMTRGIRSTVGSLIFRDHVPAEDSVVVERLRKSGAIILGKTNTPEFGLSGTTENRLGDACRNPWNLTCTSGGSSGGAAAALATGLCPLAIGSDGGGSIRIPSSFCGVYGIKPTLGRIPRYGGVGKPAPNQLSQPGPMARTVRDAALLLQVLAGHNDRDPTSLRDEPPNFLAALDQGVKGLRFAWSPDLGYAAVDPEVVRVAHEATYVFRELGAVVEEPRIEFKEPFQAFWSIFSTNAYVSYGHLLRTHSENLTSYAKAALEHGKAIDGAEYVRALRAVEELRARVDGIMQKYDLLLTPTMAVAAFPVDQHPKVIGGREVDPRWGFLPFTYPFNMTGQPAASVPCGFSSSGLPIGLQIVGRRGEESTVLRASASFEAVRSWSQNKPPVL